MIVGAVTAASEVAAPTRTRSPRRGAVLPPGRGSATGDDRATSAERFSLSATMDDNGIPQSLLPALQSVCRYLRAQTRPEPPRDIIDAVSILEVFAQDLRVRALQPSDDLGELLKGMQVDGPSECAETREGNPWAEPGEPGAGAKRGAGRAREENVAVVDSVVWDQELGALRRV